MNGSDAEQEINRIEQELDAKSPPPGKPPVSQANSEGKISSQKNQSLDAVLIGVVLLLGIGATFALGESLTRTQKTQLSAGAIGAAAGLAVGYGVGRLRP
jgi:hypothetical protein